VVSRKYWRIILFAGLLGFVLRISKILYINEPYLSLSIIVLLILIVGEIVSIVRAYFKLKRE
jgi:hypothetical protein